MSRSAAWLLLGIGLLAGFIGLLGTVAGIVALPAANPGMLMSFLLLDCFAAGLVITGIVELSKSRHAGKVPSASEAAVAPYPPGKVQTHELDGSTYSVLYKPPVPGKHPRPSALTISTAVGVSGEFRITPETWFDKMCKRFRIAVEIQTSDEAFDEACYVRSDTVAFTEAYLADPVKRVAILDMRRLGFADVTLRDGVMSVSWIGFNPATHDRPDLTADAAARLILLARNLPAPQPEFEQRTGKHRKIWQVLLWVFLGVFALTLISLAAYTPIRGSDLILPSLGLCVATLLGLAYSSACLLGGTSTSHYAWGALMIGAVFLVPLGSFGTVAFLNGILDDSQTVQHEAVIIDKYTTKSKNTTNYHVRCASWRTPGGTESFGVSGADYTAIVPNRSMIIIGTRAGGLGVEWMAFKRIHAQPR